jgi:hypothetical protein
MDWEKELIALFDDPLLADVRSLPQRNTSDDRLSESFLEIVTWIAENEREPIDNMDDFKERILFRRLKYLRADDEKRLFLKQIDILNLL